MMTKFEYLNNRIIECTEMSRSYPQGSDMALFWNNAGREFTERLNRMSCVELGEEYAC